MLGEEGFMGSGGGARSGSELSHLHSKLELYFNHELGYLHGNNGFPTV